MGIFEERKFYPSDETPIKKHYAGTFDSVFVALIPFFWLDESRISKNGYQKVHQITFSEFKNANPDMGVLEGVGDIYSNDNPDYPTDEEILHHATPVRWSQVRDESGLKDFIEINKALTTTIGGYRASHSRQDLADQLLIYAGNKKVFLPEEGTYDVLTKVSIFRTFQELNKTLVVIEDEYLQSKQTVDIRELTEEDFCKKVGQKDYYIYDLEQELLFAVDWDDFFFLIATSYSLLENILRSNLFEGFYCDEHTDVYWEFPGEEIQEDLAKTL